VAALVTLVAMIGLGLIPSVRARAKAAVMVVEALGGDVPLRGDRAVRREVSLDGVTGDIYIPARSGPPVLLVHGAAALGKDDPRLVRLARAVAGAGRVVFVPQLALAERRFVPEDIDRIVRSAVALAARGGGRLPVTVLGISYGGSFALVAAADPMLRGVLAQVAVFGAYFDLVGVLQAVTTGASVVAGRRYPWQGPPQARGILEEGATDLLPPAARDEARRALATGDPEGLEGEARALYDLLVNRDPARTASLAARLPEEVRRLLREFSPSSVAGRIDVPVIAMHSLEDPAVPLAESVRLLRALPGTRLVLVRGFRHVDFGSAGGLGVALGDLFAAWRFASWLLESQE
jgi:pimeloyl-ACP methyl ester carboxylesterase